MEQRGDLRAASTGPGPAPTHGLTVGFQLDGTATLARAHVWEHDWRLLFPLRLTLGWWLADPVGGLSDCQIGMGGLASKVDDRPMGW